jgi:hypothetical protein
LSTELRRKTDTKLKESIRTSNVFPQFFLFSETKSWEGVALLASF